MKLTDIKKFVKLENGKIVESNGHLFDTAGHGKIVMEVDISGRRACFGLWLQVVATADTIEELKK